MFILPLSYSQYDNLKNRNIFLFWTGDNELTHNRKESLEQFSRVSKCNIILITNKNLNDYILEEEPLHPAYQYLSLTHKSDYLRTYFMNFHGGGYSDIKQTTGSWVESFDVLLNRDDIYILGYKEINGGVAHKDYLDKWNELIGNGAYIAKPHTPLTEKWYLEMKNLLYNKLEMLKKYPATSIRDCNEISNYPIQWNEMLGRIFHKICYEYKDKLLNILPISIFKNYH